jgi:hypothetical protein
MEINRNRDAVTKLAWIYFAGRCGKDPDKERGFKWFKLAYEARGIAAGRLLAIVTCVVTEQLKIKTQAFASTAVGKRRRCSCITLVG